MIVVDSDLAGVTPPARTLMTMNRRNLLQSSAMLLLSAGLPISAFARSRRGSFWGKDGPGVQLYALEPDLKRDLDGTLAKVAALGIRSVEIASMHGRTPAQMRAALDKAGLRCHSVHVAASSSVPGASGLTFDDLGKLCDDLATLGASDAVLPLFQTPKGAAWGEPIPFVALVRPGPPAIGADRYARMADFLNQAGAVLKAKGIAIGYHNHNFELAPLGDKTGLQILIEKTDPAIVRFEIDTGWIAAAGQDPVAWLQRYPGRFKQMHVKDIKASTVPNFHLRQDPTEVGSGKMDWPRILPAALASGVQRFFVEQDPPFAGPRIDAITKSMAYLSTLSVAR